MWIIQLLFLIPNLSAEQTAVSFRYVFVGTGASCEEAVQQANQLVSGGRAEVLENEVSTLQVFSGAASSALCGQVLPNSSPTPAVLGEQGWKPSGTGLLPDAEKGEDLRCSLLEDGNYSTGQIVGGACLMPEVEE